jgi:hypothetical protein
MANKALQVFEPWIGQWDTVGIHGILSDTTLHGRTSFQWHESGAFVLMRSSIDDPRFPDGIAIIGSDDSLHKYSMLYYDERGVSRIQDVTMEGNVLRWSRNAPGFSQRYALALSEDKQTIIGKGELSKDGSTWEKDLDLDYTRAET